MATLTVEGDRLELRLTTWERLGALHGDLSIPRSIVASVTTCTPAMAAVGGLRIAGTGIPGKVALGTRRRSGGAREFVVVHASDPGAVVLDLIQVGGFSRVVVSAADPESLAASVR
jgi:uncharacterized protein